MDATAPMLEHILVYIGHAICVVAAFYMIKIGELKPGLVLLLGFLLQIQAGIFIGVIDYDMEAQGACWADGGSYYECLPLWFRAVIHMGQIGTILVGFGVFLSAKRIVKHVGNS